MNSSSLPPFLFCERVILLWMLQDNMVKSGCSVYEVDTCPGCAYDFSRAAWLTFSCSAHPTSQGGSCDEFECQQSQLWSREAGILCLPAASRSLALCGPPASYRDWVLSCSNCLGATGSVCFLAWRPSLLCLLRRFLAWWMFRTCPIHMVGHRLLHESRSCSRNKIVPFWNDRPDKHSDCSALGKLHSIFC